MAVKQPLKAIGLMSGTSADGIDVAYLESDGLAISLLGSWANYSYSGEFKDRLRSIQSSPINYKEVEAELTLLHSHAVENFLDNNNLSSKEIDLVGFHGHTIKHDPDSAVSKQIGDGKLLANKLKITVLNDFRSNDVIHGGQGAPLTPIFHAKLTENLEKPLAVLNIGGVANVTWIGIGEENLLAFDTGPGNAMIDDWILQHGLGEYDVDGAIAARGSTNLSVLNTFLKHPYFKRKPPKSLDRNEFSLQLAEQCNLEDGAATLSSFAVETIKQSQVYFPTPVKQWIVCGGGRHNHFLLSQLREVLDQPVFDADDLGWQGDAVEAQAFAYLAIRSSLGLPITFPNTTGVKAPITGGVRHNP